VNAGRSTADTSGMLGKLVGRPITPLRTGLNAALFGP
jgi:hypothetical protein